MAKMGKKITNFFLKDSSLLSGLGVIVWFPVFIERGLQSLVRHTETCSVIFKSKTLKQKTLGLFIIKQQGTTDM